jgi:hypothetical protein
MNFCDDCFLNAHRVEHSEQHHFPCQACCSTCVTSENLKRIGIARWKASRYCFTLGVNTMKFGRGRSRSSVYVSNNCFGLFIVYITRMIAKQFGYRVRLRGRTPIDGKKYGRFQYSLPLNDSQYLAMYFDKTQKIPNYLKRVFKYWEE